MWDCRHRDIHTDIGTCCTPHYWLVLIYTFWTDNENKTVGPAQPIKWGSQKTYSKDTLSFHVMAINLFKIPELPFAPCDVGGKSSLTTISEIHLNVTFYGTWYRSGICGRGIVCTYASLLFVLFVYLSHTSFFQLSDSSCCQLFVSFSMCRVHILGAWKLFAGVFNKL